MFSLEVFMTCLLIASTLTGFVTEAVKMMLTENGKSYRANTLAGIMALIVSAVIGVGYVLMIDAVFTTQVVVSILALTATSWLCAMVGYDKIVQAVEQFKK